MTNSEIKRACLLGCPINITDENEALSFVENKISNGEPAQIVTINPEMIDHAQVNSEFDNIVKASDLVIPDGIGVIMALRLIGVKAQRMPGIEFSEKLLKLAEEKKYKVAFLGASEEVVTLAFKELKKKYPNLNVVYTRNGFFNQNEEKLIFEEIHNSAPDIVFVGLGSPKQEIFNYKYKSFANRTIMIGVGGCFDVWSNRVKRAPLIFRKLALEWFYRLLKQPERFNRVFPTIPLFLFKVMFNKSKNRKEY